MWADLLASTRVRDSPGINGSKRAHKVVVMRMPQRDKTRGWPLYLARYAALIEGR